MTCSINYLERADRDQIMDYSFPSAGWSDCHSNVALSWPDNQVVGLQYFQSMRRHGAVVITKRLLGWSIFEDGNELPLKLTQRIPYPEKVIEFSNAKGIDIESTYSWIERNSLHLEFTVTNITSDTRKIEFAFDYEVKGRNENEVNGIGPRKHYEAGRRGYYGSGLRPMEGEDIGSWQVLIDFEKDPEAPFDSGYSVEGTSYLMHCLTKLDNRKLTLSPNSSERFSVCLLYTSPSPRD